MANETVVLFNGKFFKIFANFGYGIKERGMSFNHRLDSKLRTLSVTDTTIPTLYDISNCAQAVDTSDKIERKRNERTKKKYIDQWPPLFNFVLTEWPIIAN